ncbi:Glycoside hydrolase superfamily [Penicillium chermesinum]|uniref:Glycoside hydrolase superfamily n=1 Tax=Penicillium chermesinum TaxID=63820 RepID=A0A9W9PFL3_9EURO|nr:Glycoside hydrolase superfamily [Penicillium chermesinum]KAJ5245835.1 Glycoside hydrolase superfamily [Penicillium chermesinum]KAJ6144134.1 Glycoside hydrolase superfamily [Penicillium chermesinum]
MLSFFRRRGADADTDEPQASSKVPLYTNAAYYPNWRIYRNQPPSSLRLGFISHLYYAFAWVKEDGEIYVCS